jgi:hypothetical protein
MKSVIATILFLASVLSFATQAATQPAGKPAGCTQVAGYCVPKGTVYSIIYTLNPGGGIGSSFGSFYPTYNDCITVAVHNTMHPVFTAMATIQCYSAG